MTLSRRHHHEQCPEYD